MNVGMDASTGTSRRPSGAAGEAIIEVRDLHKSFGTQHVLRGINLRIATGETTVIIGGSGSGKSVLLKHLIALMRPDHGQVLFHGQDIFDMNPRGWRCGRGRSAGQGAARPART